MNIRQPRQVKNKILRAILELPAKQNCQFGLLILSLKVVGGDVVENSLNTCVGDPERYIRDEPCLRVARIPLDPSSQARQLQGTLVHNLVR